MQPRTAVLTILMLAAGVSGVVAQPAKTLLDAHRYTEAIDQLRGGTDATPMVLGEAHLRRGYALRDLARLQAEVGAAYYTKRDTSAAARSGITTAYYAARHQLAAPTGGDGAQALRRLVQRGALPAALQARAQVWLGWAQYRDGEEAAAKERWARLESASDPAVAADRALAHWRAGEPLPTLTCGSGGTEIATLRCRLWTAIRAEDWDRATSLQGELIQQERPAERTKTYRTEQGDTYKVRFYDPSTLWVLAVADFRAGAAALRRADGDQSNLLAGLAALKGRDHETAGSALDAAGATAYRAVYRAVLGEKTGTPSATGSLWKKGRQHSTVRVRSVWAQEASRYESYRSAVRDYFETQDAPDDMRTALRLGRAALNVDRSETAYRMMNAAYPVNQNNDLRAVDPAYLATFARAKFREGAQYESEILRHVEAFRTEYPIASIAYSLAQGYYVPERTDGLVR